jgi:secondary thiamine-phosphate synthase enzyme
VATLLFLDFGSAEQVGRVMTVSGLYPDYHGVRHVMAGMKKFSIQTEARTQFVNISALVQQAVSELGLQDGMVTVFVPHTTAAVTINENADPDVLRDLRHVFDKLVPWEDGYRHREGNSAAHAKSSLVGVSEQVIVQQGRLCLGTWQSVFFCEFDGPRNRTCWVTVQ